ncbi:MAG: phosphocholine cytidylyltransferase family protein [Candidatus Kerfeldbacteria bacterium]|nr:phosphocholine cytidylyltransferase family protein [Candidatus Kerfeldbacteria bacterium]
MRCIILAGGVSKRLRPKTDTIPKTLLPVDEKIILEHILDNARHAGMEHFDILTGHGHEFVEEFTSRYADANDVSIDLHFIPEYATTGNIIGIPSAEHLFDDDFVWINSDTIFHTDILKKLLASPEANAMMVDDVKTLGEEEMKVLADENGYIQRIHKTLDPATAHGEYVGILRFSKPTKDALLAAAEKKMGEDPLVYYEDAIQQMIDDYGTQIKKISTEGLPVMEIDTHEDLEAAKELIKQIRQ